jgi:hypothetical protein
MTQTTNYLRSLVWKDWVDSAITMSAQATHLARYGTTTVDYLWPKWVTDVATTSIEIPMRRPVQATIQVIDREQERLAVRHRMAEQESERLRWSQAMKEAEERSLALLLAMLPVELAVELRTKKFFTITTPAGNRYQIHGYRTHNVKQLDTEGKPFMSYCYHSPSHIPIYDSMVAQLLLLMTDEEDFLARANRRDLRTGLYHQARVR